MSDPTIDRPDDGDGSQPGPVIRDRRRLDPQTGQVRDAYAASAPGGSAPGEPAPDPDGSAAGAPDGSSGDPVSLDQPGNGSIASGENAALDGILADLDAAQSSAAERLSDLQRLQAEFINYRRRVDRDRDVARDTAIAGVLESLLPVLDDIHLARQHGDLESGPFAAIAEKLETVLERHGLQRYGDTGEAFDPAVHEALMHTEAELAEGTTTTTVVQVLQPGYRSGERVLRAARVAVADPS
jgi:molecular chaperone GrpE